MAATLFLGQHVDLGLELGVRLDRAGLGQNLATHDVLALHTAQQRADVVAGLALVHVLVEHLDAGDDGLGAVGVDPDDLDFLVPLQPAALDPARSDRAATFDREHVFDRHQERLVDRPLRLRDIGVDGVHQLHDLRRPLGVAFEGLEGRDANNGNVVARVLVLAEQLAQVQLDQLDELLVIDHVALVQRNHEEGHVDLARQDDVLAGLRHGAVVGGNDEDRAVHLSGAGDHIFDVILMPRAVHVCVVTLLGLVLHVGDRYRDAAGFLFRCLVDAVEGREFRQTLLREHLRDGSRQRRLPVVDVTNGPNVEVRLGPLELLLRHCFLLTNFATWYGGPQLPPGFQASLRSD